MPHFPNTAQWSWFISTRCYSVQAALGWEEACGHFIKADEQGLQCVCGDEGQEGWSFSNIAPQLWSCHNTQAMPGEERKKRNLLTRSAFLKISHQFFSFCLFPPVPIVSIFKCVRCSWASAEPDQSAWTLVVTTVPRFGASTELPTALMVIYLLIFFQLLCSEDALTLASCSPSAGHAQHCWMLQ